MSISKYFYGINVVFLSKYLFDEFDIQININIIHIQYPFERLWVKIQEKTVFKNNAQVS